MSLRTLILHPTSPTLLLLFLPPEIKPTETSRVCSAITELSPSKFQEILIYSIILIIASCTSVAQFCSEKFTPKLVEITLSSVLMNESRIDFRSYKRKIWDCKSLNFQKKKIRNQWESALLSVAEKERAVIVRISRRSLGFWGGWVDKDRCVGFRCVELTTRVLSVGGGRKAVAWKWVEEESHG